MPEVESGGWVVALEQAKVKARRSGKMAIGDVSAAAISISLGVINATNAQ